MVERNEYLSKLISAKENGFLKIITGIRRCGKSSLLKDIFKNYLLTTGVKEEQTEVSSSLGDMFVDFFKDFKR